MAHLSPLASRKGKEKEKEKEKEKQSMSPITRVRAYPIIPIPIPGRSIIYPHKTRPVISVGIKRFAAVMSSREFVRNASNIRPTVISPPSA